MAQLEALAKSDRPEDNAAKVYAEVAALPDVELDVPQRWVLQPRDLVLKQPTTRWAAELAELHRVIDEPFWFTDQHIRYLDRPIGSVTVQLVVVAHWPQRLTTPRAGEPGSASVHD